jgi:hypothetical protein
MQRNGTAEAAQVRRHHSPEYVRMRELIDRLERIVERFEELDAEEALEEERRRGS